ncbi:MAG TPA: thiamine diphosphokinase [Roseiflexaceae bacterium]|jgi:thiamine pyrophosphokinase
MYVVIVANAPNLDAAPYEALIRAADLLIAADGGALPLLRLNRLPRLVVGDLDSLDSASQATLLERGVELRRFPREKDETDLELALAHAAASGATTIDILGALGGRWDHTLANVALLALTELRGRRVRLLDARQELFLVRDSAVLEGQAGDTVSLLPLTPTARGVTTHGLLYPLQDATLHYERARGVSNVLLEPPGRVSLRDGLLLVVHHDDGGAYQFYQKDQDTTSSTSEYPPIAPPVH